MKDRLLIMCFLISGFFACSQKPQGNMLTREEALRLSALPLKCMQKPYPNKLSQTLADSSELKTPEQLHPAFYGCFDWHSAVHGHWMLIRLLKLFPDLPDSKEIRQKLSQNITAANILQEVNYFRKPLERSYERTYGWAWLLKLAAELHTWNDPIARSMEKNLQPLTDEIVGLYLSFLPKLNYPVRVGEHPNTAFGLAFAWDFAHTTGNDSLLQLVENRARDFYLRDENCPLNWEPGGTDFFSPCLEEADLMRRVLPAKEYQVWLKKFLPALSDPSFKFAPGVVSDRTDGKLVHLDGLNFSRARCLNGIAQSLPEYAHLRAIAKTHIDFSLPVITDGSYEGEHWLASFALLALESGK
jgi:hypothetical protein